MSLRTLSFETLNPDVLQKTCNSSVSALFDPVSNHTFPQLPADVGLAESLPDMDAPVADTRAPPSARPPPMVACGQVDDPSYLDLECGKPHDERSGGVKDSVARVLGEAALLRRRHEEAKLSENLRRSAVLRYNEAQTGAVERTAARALECGARHRRMAECRAAFSDADVAAADAVERAAQTRYAEIRRERQRHAEAALQRAVDLRTGWLSDMKGSADRATREHELTAGVIAIQCRPSVSVMQAHTVHAQLVHSRRSEVTERAFSTRRVRQSSASPTRAESRRNTMSAPVSPSPSHGRVMEWSVRRQREREGLAGLVCQEVDERHEKRVQAMEGAVGTRAERDVVWAEEKLERAAMQRDGEASRQAIRDAWFAT
eukprot:Hpha_TRINITY_DN34982_c0_g1::TRINITY_DN34982_c0_g1_i1::g.184194::m.184194